MNYVRIYDAIIDRGKTRIISGYKESHHVIPKCMGGTNDASNLVFLTPEEHYVAHQLLVKIFPNNRKLIYAAILMTSSTKRVNRTGNKLYGWLRKHASETMSKSLLAHHHNKGKPASNRGIPHTQETKDKISAANKGKIAHNKGKPGLFWRNPNERRIPDPVCNRKGN